MVTARAKGSDGTVMCTAIYGNSTSGAAGTLWVAPAVGGTSRGWHQPQRPGRRRVEENAGLAHLVQETRRFLNDAGNGETPLRMRGSIECELRLEEGQIR